MARKNKLRVFGCVLVAMVLFLISIGAQAASFTQWAVEARASSQYSSGNWSAKQMVGEPNTYPKHGDIATAWAPSRGNGGAEWVELTYEEAVIVEQIDIYETCNPGAITKVELADESGNYHLVWQGVAEAMKPAQARIFRVTNTRVQVPSRTVRITLDTSKVPGWNEIDAVALIGDKSAPASGGYVGWGGGADVVRDLDAVLARLADAIARAKTGKSAHPDFLADLDGIMDMFHAISDDIHQELGDSTGGWGSY